MSQKRAKAARRALGISKAAARAEAEFAQEIARRRYARQVDAEQPIVSLEPKRRALAWVGLVIVAVLVGLAVLGALAP